MTRALRAAWLALEASAASAATTSASGGAGARPERLTRRTECPRPASCLASARPRGPAPKTTCSSGNGRTPVAAMSVLAAAGASDGDRLELDQVLGVGQAGHDDHADGRRRRGAPDPAEDAEGRPHILPLDDVDRPLDDVVQLGTGARQHRLQILEDLLGLPRQIT